MANRITPPQRIQLPFNTADDGLAYTVTTRYGAMCESNLKDGNFPMTGILEIINPTKEIRQMIEDGTINFDKGLPKTCALRGRDKDAGCRQVAQLYDEETNPVNGRVYDPEGVAPTLRTPTGGLSEPKVVVPINTTSGGVSPCITSHYHKVGHTDLDPTGVYPNIAVVEIEGVSVHPLSHAHEFNGKLNEDVSPCLRSTDYKAPHCVWEKGEAPVQEPQTADPQTQCLNYYDENGNIRSVQDRVYDCGGDSTAVTTSYMPSIAEPCYGNKNLQKLVDSGKVTGDKLQYLDTYNHIVKDDVAGTITTRVYASSQTFISETLEGLDGEVAILTPRRTEEGRELRKQGVELFANRELVPREDGMSNTITTVTKDNLLQEPKIIQKVGDRGTDNYSVNEISNTIAANPMSDRGQLLVEPGRDGCEYKGKHINEGDGFYSATTMEFFRGGLDGVSRTLKSEKQDASVCVKDGVRYRIRKLTPRECFRLMGVSESDIDKMQSAGISKSAQYKLAGNSIVVDVLYHIFRKMFVDVTPDREAEHYTLF